MNTLSKISLRNLGITKLLLGGLTVLLLLSPLTCLAQEQQRGTYPQGSYALSNIESINPVNGNLMFNFPIGSLPAGRKGMAAGVALHYNSKLYDSYIGTACYNDVNNQYVCTQVEQLMPSPEGGWRYGFQYKLQVYWNPNLGCMNAFKVVMSFPDGSIHEFRPYGYSEPVTNEGYYAIGPDGYGFNSGCQQTLLNTGTMTYFSTDGTYLRLEVQHDTNDGWENNPWTLYLPDGGKVKFKEAGANGLRIYDSNSNYIEVQKLVLPNGHPVDKIIDQFNRSITIEQDPNIGTLVKVPGANGQTLTWTITGITILANSYPDYFEYYSNGSSGEVLTFFLPGTSGINQIISPSQAGGYAYTFDYNYPNAGQGFCEVKSVTLPSADQNKAKATYAYTTTSLSTPFVNDVLENKITQKTLKYLKQYDNPTTFDNPANYVSEVWTYAHADPWAGGLNTVTSPDGSVIKEWSYGRLDSQYFPEPAWKVGVIYKSERPDGSVVERIWQPNRPQSPYLATDMNAYVKTEFVSLKNAAGTLVKTAITNYNYDKNGNLTQRADYDFVDYGIVPRDSNGRPTGIPATAVPKTVTVNTYSSPTPDASDKTTVTPNAYNKPGSPNVRIAMDSSEVRSGFSATTALTRTEFFYDDALNTANPIQIRSWDSNKNNTSQAITRPLTAANSSSVYIQYDAYGNKTLVTDAKNVQTKFDYDPVVTGNPSTANLYVTKIRKAYGTSVQLSSSFMHDFASGLTITATDDDNQVTNKTTYDDLGRPILVQGAFGTALERRVVSQYYDASRTVVTKSDLNTVGDSKLVTIQHSDQLGRNRLNRTLEDPATQSATDETTGIKVQTRFISTSTNTYKLVSNPYRAASSTAASSEYTMGWARETMDRTGRVIESESFDGSGLPAPWGTNSSSMGKVTIAYDANYTTTTDQTGKVKRTRVNGLGKLDRTDEPNSANSLGAQDTPIQPTYYTYDALSRLTQVSQGVQTRSFVYSSLSRLLSATNPEKGGPDTYEYDANGNATKQTDARGWYATSTYDELNRVKTIDYSNTAVSPDIKKFYDNPTAGKYGKGRYWYDYAGGDATTGQTVENSSVDGYDILGRPLSLTQKFKTNGTWSAAFTTSHAYDLAGNVKEKTLPSLHKLTYSFDAIGRLSQMVGNIGDGVQRTYTTGITYNSAGQMTREQFGTTTPLYHNRHFNNRGQLYDVRLGTNGSDEWTWNRGALRIYNNANSTVGNGGTLNNGNVYRVDHFVPLNDAVTAWFMPVDFYGFDELNRITGIWEQTYDSTGYANYNTLNQTYSYDRYGNRAVSGTLNISSPSFKYVAASNRQKAPTDSDTDSVTDKMRYDAVGNLIKDIYTQGGTGDRTYDINNQMLTAIGPSGLLNNYAYDAAGHRVRRSINNGQSVWWQVYGIGGEVVAEYAAGASPALPQKEYGYRQGELLVVGDVAAGCITRWLVTDQVGTPRILADTTGSLAGIRRHDYLPFGEELTAGYGGRTNAQGYSGDCVRDKFVGYERDGETGLDYAEARYHGSVYGRFTSVDPAMGSARKSMPQSWNRYSYVLNRPLSLIDPTGEFWIYKANEWPIQPHKGAPKIEEANEYHAQGYQLFEDNAEVDFDGRGTGWFAEYNYEHARLGDDGQVHIIRRHPADKVAGIMLLAYVAPLAPIVVAPAVPEVATGRVILQALGTPQGLAAIALIAGVGGAAVEDVLTDEPPDDDEKKGFYVRFGDGPETVESLTNDANKTIGTKFPYGVSVMYKERISGSDRQNRYAPAAEAEAVFQIEQTGNNPRHHTVHLPNPVTPESTARFNSIFRKR